MNTNAHNAAIVATQLWIDNVVIGLNFCPFAKREVLRNSIHYRGVECKKATQWVSVLQAEIERLDHNPNVETTFIVAETGLGLFYDYLDVYHVLDTWLTDNHYEGVYQIASFHPEYTFEGEASDSASHFTNRSPYPMFHILRESSVDIATTAHKDAASIPDNNITMAQLKGKDWFEQMLRRCINPE